MWSSSGVLSQPIRGATHNPLIMQAGTPTKNSNMRFFKDASSCVLASRNLTSNWTLSARSLRAVKGCGIVYERRNPCGPCNTVGVKKYFAGHENARTRTAPPAWLILLSFSYYLDWKWDDGWNTRCVCSRIMGIKQRSLLGTTTPRGRPIRSSNSNRVNWRRYDGPLSYSLVRKSRAGLAML
jgi:hypothetical protein